MSDPAYIMALKARLAWFRDGHTTLYISAITAPGFELALPIAVRTFYDGLLVSGAKDEGSPLLGARLVRVDGIPIAELMRRFARDWPATNAAWAHHDAALALTPAILRGAPLSTAGPLTAPVAVEGEIEGHMVKAMLTPRAGAKDGFTRVSRPASAIETWRPRGTANLMHRDGEALIIAFDDLSGEAKPTMAFVSAVFAAAEAPSVERVILDLRRNGGGDNFLGEGLRKYLERSRFNRPGGLYVLIGPQTFSAAQDLASRLERETYAIFFGEPTGGAPNHFGDAALFDGGDFKAGVSTKPWFDSYPTDARTWTMPDLLIPAHMADWMAGRDAVMEAALGHKSYAKIDDLSQDRTFFYARASQKQSWTPFWME